MKDMILQETAALMPDELAPNRDALLATQVHLRTVQTRLLKFLYESDLSNNVLPFFDPTDINPVTDSYLSTILNVTNYDRSLAGIWCLTTPDFIISPLTWSEKEDQLVKDGHPYTTFKNEGCFWKLIPHANNLFTIENRYECPDHRHCGKYLNVDILGDDMENRAVIQQYPRIWEIHGTQRRR